MKHYATALLVHLLVHGVAPASAETPVFTAREADAYVGTSSADVDVDYNSVVATEDNGLTVTFGTDLSSTIRSTYDDKCSDNGSDECKQAMRQVLGLSPSADGMQKRLIGVVAVLGAVALAHVVLEAILLYDEARQPEKIQITIPQDQKDEISAWDTSSNEFSFDPINGDPFTIDMNVDPLSYKPAEIPSATKEENGDIVLSVGSLGPTISDAFSNALCERGLVRRSLMKRALTVGCVASKIRKLMLLFQPGGQLQDFRYIDPVNFQFPDPIDNGMLSEALGLTQGFSDDLYLPDTAQETREAMHKVSAWMAFTGSSISTDGKLTFSSDFLEFQKVEDGDEEDEEDNSECPTGQYVPFCGNCGGDVSSSSNEMEKGYCKGLSDAEDDYYKGCACIIDPANGPYTVGTDWSAFQQILDDGGEESEDTSEEDSGPEKNAALSIIAEKDGDDITWVFYQTPRGQPAGCTTDKTVVFRSPTWQGGDIDSPGYPGGDYNFDIWGRSCKWRGDSTNPGELICDNERFGCQAASSSASTMTCDSPSSKQQHEGVFCEFTTDNMDASPSNPYTTGWCKVDFWHDFNMAGTIGAKTKMRVYGITDRTGKDLGGSWGGPSDAGDVIGNEQEIILESALPHTLRIIPHKWGDNGIWNYRKKFDLDYNGQEWNEGTTDQSTGHCEESVKKSAAENGGNRYKFGWYCYFQC